MDTRTPSTTALHPAATAAPAAGAAAAAAKASAGSLAAVGGGAARKGGRSDFSLAASSASSRLLASKGYSRNALAGTVAAKRAAAGAALAAAEPVRSAAAVAEMAVVEENRRMAVRLANIEADGGKADFGYAVDGRIVRIKSRIVEDDADGDDAESGDRRAVDPGDMQDAEASESPAPRTRRAGRGRSRFAAAEARKKLVPPLAGRVQPMPVDDHGTSKSTLATTAGSTTNNAMLASMASVSTIAPAYNGRNYETPARRHAERRRYH
ncbi:hypothetical protein HK405_008968 [Cladochytrium tenue]|nr:hypothetical protein HK405_008968 [Cladochytrium tenue]